ncbi:unnamed protein product [marine sediment metagenome]|uniref:Uncharacterized protein n=1 Tax=marine sediment metagenome TaxID=412755 RepID=X1SLS0_9ZZZZ
MTEERIEEQATKPKPTGFTVCNCKLEVVTDPDGKRHFEATCLNKEARDDLASIFEQEAILRINPKVILEEIPPVAEPK